jgi:hypothetical protein
MKKNGVLQNVLESYEYFKYRLSEYPKCGKHIKLSHPNLNAPFQAAQNLMGNIFFLELYENPDDVHWLVDHVTDRYLELFKIVDPLMNNKICDDKYIYFHGAIYPCRTLLRNDTQVAMISEEHYLEFVRPSDERVAKELGDVCLHYCGASKPFTNRVIGVPGLKGINYGDSQLQDLDAIIRDWNGKNIAIIGWGWQQPPEFLYNTLHGRNLTGFTLSCLLSDREKGREYIKRYRETGVEGLNYSAI